ncbi:MAG: YajQ family cyclic di-GMP-binding protein [Bacteroidetes bacterium]|nr:YajQ family cyclic di-GMP-binding protein [Bacteroidota bacterium]
MPAFDIVSKIEIQKLDNAINVASRELSTRFDFHNSKTEIKLDKKEMMIHVLTENDMRMKTIEGIIIARMLKQGLEPSCLDFGKELYASGNMVKKDIKVKQGIDKDTARKIVKIIKDSGMKVQPSIMDEQVRVSGKKIDDLQEIISIVKKSNLDLPLQYENFRN